jgi:hypothetical protein
VEAEQSGQPLRSKSLGHVLGDEKVIAGSLYKIAELLSMDFQFAPVRRQPRPQADDITALRTTGSLPSVDRLCLPKLSVGLPVQVFF